MPRPRFTPAFARLVTGGAACGRCYRPLVAGAALLRRSPAATSWSVPLASDRLLLPATPPRRADLDRLVSCLAARGTACRVGAALAGPLDAVALAGADRATDIGTGGSARAGRLRLDIYGWALMYQPPGMRGRAVIDVDDRFPDLPAVFELPLELIDRAEFLEARGFRTRPLLVPTLPGDFARGPDGRLRNRFFPDAALRPPCGTDLLL